MDGLIVREASSTDRDALASLRAELWPEGDLEEHVWELGQILSGRWSASYPYIVLVAEISGAIVGFAEICLRSAADGCDRSHPVGYLEGWYVDQSHRGRGIGARLIASFEAWALENGCNEVASDTWIDNEPSQRAHEALGYEVVDRCVNYRKRLQGWSGLKPRFAMGSSPPQE